MSRLRIFDTTHPEQPQAVHDTFASIQRELHAIGVTFEHWAAHQPVQAGDAPERILEAYRADIDQLVAARGFRSVDVISIAPDHPERETLRRKFLDEHFHKEDEVRFFVAGSGLFTLHVGDAVYEVCCTQGDLIGVPDRTLHWFDMGPEPSFVAIRFFTAADGWVGHFTGSGLAAQFPRYEPGQAA